MKEKAMLPERAASHPSSRPKFRRHILTGCAVIPLLIGALFVSGYGGLLGSQFHTALFTASAVSSSDSGEGAVTCASSEGDWSLILVNRTHPLPDDYQVDLTTLSNGQSVDSRIYPALQQMFDAARADGQYPVVASGYRTTEKQQSLMDEKIAAFESEGDSPAEAKTAAEAWVALPGTSEHQLGMAVDINADGIHSTGEAVYQWLNQNSYKYGFILRYPADKTDLTGISNEPWHYRYVGVTAAAEIHQQGICLEEYLSNQQNS